MKILQGYYKQRVIGKIKLLYASYCKVWNNGDKIFKKTTYESLFFFFVLYITVIKKKSSFFKHCNEKHKWLNTNTSLPLIQ